MQHSLPVVTSLLKETHVWNKALCLYFSLLCFPGGKWQMSGSRVGLSAPLKPCCYNTTNLNKYFMFYKQKWDILIMDICEQCS